MRKFCSYRLLYMFSKLHHFHNRIFIVTQLKLFVEKIKDFQKFVGKCVIFRCILYYIKPN